MVDRFIFAFHLAQVGRGILTPYLTTLIAKILYSESFYLHLVHLFLSESSEAID
jgi:hypothetical protein